MSIPVDAYGGIPGSGLYVRYDIPDFGPNPVLGDSGVVFDFGPDVGHFDPPYHTFPRLGPTVPFTRAQVLDRGPQSVTTGFTVNGLDVTLEQTLRDVVDGSSRVGSVLDQTFHIGNPGVRSVDFALFRYAEAFIIGTGFSTPVGRTIENGVELLFALGDFRGDLSNDPVLVGITSTGGTEPESNRYEAGGRPLVTRFGPLQELRDFVANDRDGDGVSDRPHSFAPNLILRNTFSLAPGETDTYFTQTLFGEASPAAPGSREVLPVLPDAISDDGGFVFEFDPDDLIPGETIFFDPEIAVGYTYEVTGAAFDSVTAPTVSAVADPDGYTLSFALNGSAFTVALASGETIRFGDVAGPGFDLDALTMFSITGIDPALGLDPDNPTAFVTGASFRAINGPVTLTQTAISAEASPVPLPAPMLLLGSGLLALGAATGLRRT